MTLLSTAAGVGGGQVIKADPTAMTYAAVFNLCTLYDLQVSGHAGSPELLTRLLCVCRRGGL